MRVATATLRVHRATLGQRLAIDARRSKSKSRVRFFEREARAAAVTPRVLVGPRALRFGIVSLVVAVSGALGMLIGSGGLTGEGRYYARQVAAQSGELQVRATPPLFGRRSAEELVTRSELVRQFMVLDGAN